jgi:hypothetical protein
MGYGVVSIDNEEFSLNELYKNSRGNRIFCAKIDVVGSRDNAEWWERWDKVVASDVVFCSSITHHLYKSGMDWYKQAELWRDIGKKYLIVEMIDSTDKFVKEWNMGGDYTKEKFLQVLEKDWWLLDTKPSDTVGRQWYFLKKGGING